MEGPRFFQPHAPRRDGTSHPATWDDTQSRYDPIAGRRKSDAAAGGAGAVVGGSRLQTVTSLLQRMIRRRAGPQAAAAVVAEQKSIPRAKLDFEGSKYNKHTMKVDNSWKASAIDFGHPVSREGRARAQRQYETHANDILYFEASDVGESDPRRRTSKPGYRVKGGRSFSTQTSREQRALCGRSLTIVERESILQHVTAHHRQQQQQVDPDDVAPVPRSTDQHQEEKPHPLSTDEAERHAPVRRPASAPAVRGPCFDRSAHTTVSRLAREAQDEALLWGTGGSSKLSRGSRVASSGQTPGERWTPFSLAPYNTTPPSRQALHAPSFATMANHYGYASAGKKPPVDETSSSVAGEATAALPTDKGRAATGASKGVAFVEEGKRHSIVDKRAISVPDFAKSLGKDAKQVGYLAKEPTRDVDFGLHVHASFFNRHVRTIDLSKSGDRPPARQVPYSTNMQLFPKYDVIDIAAKSPRIVPPTHATHHQPSRRPMSAPVQRQPTPASGSRTESLSPVRADHPEDTTANLSYVSTTASPVRAAAAAAPSAQRRVLFPGSTATSPPAIKDDLCHPRLVRNISLGPRPSKPQLVDEN